MFEALITFVMRVEVMDTSRNYYGGTPCAMKVACTVWTGGKDGDSIKILSIGIDKIQSETTL